jgi:hypothetical protein
VRCAGQDDDPHSGSRGIFARVKPDKHSPVLWDEKKLPAHEPVGDGVLDVPRFCDGKACVCNDFIPSCRGDLGSPALVPYPQEPRVP